MTTKVPLIMNERPENACVKWMMPTMPPLPAGPVKCENDMDVGRIGVLGNVMVVRNVVISSAGHPTLEKPCRLAVVILEPASGSMMWGDVMSPPRLIWRENRIRGKRSPMIVAEG
jgi:hypothetical protein